MIVNGYWLVILAAVVAAGIWLGQALLALAGLLGLLVAGTEQLWFRTCLSGVEYERSLGATHAFWGEEVRLTQRLANRKILPLTWLRVDERVPRKLPIDHATLVASADMFTVSMRNLLPLLPYEQVVRRYTVRCRHRGLFEFGPGWVESGDLLGYRSRGVRYGKIDKLLIYPKLFDLQLPPLLSRRIVGRQAIDRVILTDPSRTVGVRPYRSGDSLRHVEWRASARSTETLVRVFEPTTDLGLAVFLNFKVPSFSWRNPDPPELEFSISLAASLAKWSLERGFPAGMFGNGVGEGMQGVRLPVSRDLEHLRRILEALALASSYGKISIAQTLAAEAPGLPFEVSVVLITTGLDEALLTALLDINRRRPVTVLYVRTPGSPDVRLPGLKIVTVPYDDDWHEINRLQLAA